MTAAFKIPSSDSLRGSFPIEDLLKFRTMLYVFTIANQIEINDEHDVDVFLNRYFGNDWWKKLPDGEIVHIVRSMLEYTDAKENSK